MDWFPVTYVLFGGSLLILLALINDTLMSIARVLARIADRLENRK